MTMRERLPARAPDSVDLSDTLELLASLTQYAEAGAVQPHTLAQAAKHALEQHGEHVDVLFAVAKLYLATGDRSEAGKLLQRASQIAPGDNRAAQLMIDAGIELSRHAPITPRNVGVSPSLNPSSGPRSVHEQVRPRRSIEPAPDEPPSAKPGSVARPVRGESTMRSLAALGAIVREEPSEPPRVPETTPPATPRSVVPEGPLLRPTVRMARVAGAPDRGRWGKPSEGREPLDSRPEREPASENPRSERADRSESARGQRGRVDAAPASTSMRTPRQGVAIAKTGRAATGNLKLLDPSDERRRLDRYELIGEIAAGGMASVFLARAAGVAGFQRFFAIKRLHPHLADEQEFIDMFLDEARLAAGIHHPNVVPILEVGTTEAGYYLVMDYIEGDTLSGVINRSLGADGLPLPIALRIVLDALHGLHAAHELVDAEGHPVDLVHRDCSPQNILVGIDGSSRLTDFGVARASSRLSTTRSATVKGKLAYLSPEQATGRDIDRRSDLFGMGVILWEVLAGRRLFRADSDGATLSRILVEPIPSLLEHVPDIPEELAEATMKALARDVADRHATASDMADAIEQSIRDAGDPQIFVASPREVAAYMREMFGADVAARRDAVRAWIAKCGDVDAASGPRSQAPRRASAGSPASSRDRPRSPESTSDPDSSPRDSSDPISYTNEPPSSKTEPSAVHVEEAAALSASAADKRARDANLKPDPNDEKADPTADAAPAAAPSVPDLIVANKPDAAPEAPPDRRKHLPIPLIVFAIVLVVLALATYVSSRRSGKPVGAASPPPSPAAATI